MTNRDVAFIGSRLLAVYLLIFIIRQVGFFSTLIAAGLSQERFTVEIVPHITLVSAYSILALILWFSADRVSQLVVRGEKRLDRTTEQGKGTIRDFQAAAFSLVGLLVIIDAVSPLVNNAAHLLLWNEELYGALPRRFNIQVSLAAAVLQLVLGICLLLGAKGVVNLISRGRTLGIKNNDKQDIM